jgi:predicted site-specific integrase-resolvase
MSITIEQKKFYRTKEACLKAGISKATYHRWIKQGIISDNIIKDRRGWRLFSEADIENIKMEAVKLSTQAVQRRA